MEETWIPEKRIFKNLSLLNFAEQQRQHLSLVTLFTPLLHYPGDLHMQAVFWAQLMTCTSVKGTPHNKNRVQSVQYPSISCNKWPPSAAAASSLPPISHISCFLARHQPQLLPCSLSAAAAASLPAISRSRFLLAPYQPQQLPSIAPPSAAAASFLPTISRSSCFLARNQPPPCSPLLALTEDDIHSRRLHAIRKTNLSQRSSPQKHWLFQHAFLEIQKCEKCNFQNFS